MREENCYDYDNQRAMLHKSTAAFIQQQFPHASCVTQNSKKQEIQICPIQTPAHRIIESKIKSRKTPLSNGMYDQILRIPPHLAKVTLQHMHAIPLDQKQNYSRSALLGPHRSQNKSLKPNTIPESYMKPTWNYTTLKEQKC